MNVTMSDVDIPELLRFFFNFFKPQTDTKGLKLDIETNQDTSHSVIRTDRTKLESMISNLIKNAVKFTEEGYIRFGNYIEDGTMVFFVEDTGSGIAPSRFKMIFERFVQGDMSSSRTYEGSGLGLSIVKAYSEMLGGKVWVESEIGKGSRFFFTLPLTDPENVRKQTFSESPVVHSSGDKLNILVVEDDQTSYLYLEKILESENVNLIHAVNGEETVSLVKENESLDLVLMDLKIPIISGLEATRMIRQFNTRIPIIAQTAYAFASDRESALEAGCTAYISKPINKPELLRLIRQFSGSTGADR
jgi:CheY-like chemotaxis protein